MATHLVNEFARDVRAGLSQKGQKMLPSRYLYDNVGSALFEAICALPEYGLTRADRFSTRHTRREIFTPGSSSGGGGSGSKSSRSRKGAAANDATATPSDSSLA